MGARFSFDIPVGKEQSTAGARRAYLATWGWEWPHDDAYLRELAQRVPTTAQLYKGNGKFDRRTDFLLNLMRENDDDATRAKAQGATP